MKHYDWSQIPAERMNPLMVRRVLHGGSMTIVRMELLKDAVVPEHSHRHEQIATVERGSLQFAIGGGQQVVRAGESLVIPPHLPHAAVALEDSLVMDLFSPAREDWIAGNDAYLRR
jgi:quercetin dioxygenase-like cupin family protein